jgi:hypothetical protein
MVISTMRHRAPKSPIRSAKPRILTEYEIARKEAEQELRNYEAEQDSKRIAEQVRSSVIRAKRETFTLVKM